jgi:hypothetical protein
MLTFTIGPRWPGCRDSGVEFDTAYIKGQLGVHALTLDLLEMQEKSGI